MLFGSTLLEVAIGVIFVYLLLSMLCSALSEFFESLLKYRARDLEGGIKKLLDDPGLINGFFNHALIKALGEQPSYIPARTFSLALWNLATEKAAEGKAVAVGVTQDLVAIRTSIASLDKQKYAAIRTALLTLFDEAGGDLNRARTNIEDWYNDAMDRVSGKFKRRTHWILLSLGLVAASMLNIDTINIVQALWYNDTLRASVATAADTYIKGQPTPAPAATSLLPAVTATSVPVATPQPDAPPTPLQKVRAVRDELNSLGLPIGWSTQPSPHGANGWLLKILGLIFTALAVSQGAPFWFDLLNKIIVIRSTVKPHEKSLEQPSKDKPAPDPVPPPTEQQDKPAGKGKG